MDPIREGMFKLVDKGATTFQLVGQTFGFLPDGRELVRTEVEEGGLRVFLSDRSEEGWPPFSLNLPEGSDFSHASMSLLTRIAHWTIRDHPRAVLDHLSNHNKGLAQMDPGPRKGQRFSLENGVTVTVAGSESRNLTFLVMTQERDPDAVEEGIKARIRTTARKYQGNEARRGPSSQDGP